MCISLKGFVDRYSMSVPVLCILALLMHLHSLNDKVYAKWTSRDNDVLKND